MCLHPQCCWLLQCSGSPQEGSSRELLTGIEKATGANSPPSQSHSTSQQATLAKIAAKLADCQLNCDTPPQVKVDSKEQSPGQSRRQFKLPPEYHGANATDSTAVQSSTSQAQNDNDSPLRGSQHKCISKPTRHDAACEHDTAQTEADADNATQQQKKQQQHKQQQQHDSATANGSGCKVAIKHTATAGRSLVAAASIMAGEVVLEEDPICWVVSQQGTKQVRCLAAAARTGAINHALRQRGEDEIKAHLLVPRLLMP